VSQVREAVASVVHAVAAEAPAVFLSTLRRRLPYAPATSPSHLTALMALVRVAQVRPRTPNATWMHLAMYAHEPNSPKPRPTKQPSSSTA
jgi:hypothetical protein